MGFIKNNNSNENENENENLGPKDKTEIYNNNIHFGNDDMIIERESDIKRILSQI